MAHATKTIHLASAPVSDGSQSTGMLPTKDVPERVQRRYENVHLLGPGAVGREFLKLLAEARLKLTAVSDSTATWHDANGIDPLAVVRWKQDGRKLVEHPAATGEAAAAVLERCNADIVVDASSTELGRANWTTALHSALRRGACVASAAKASLCEAGAEWLSGEHAARVGINAVLGGTGRSFITDLPELRRRVRSITIVGNASTTAILQAVENGATLEQGIAEAQRQELLEPDPELDLRGTDAAVKLAIVAGILTNRCIDPHSIPCEDIRTVDLSVVRARAANGATTRLVARLTEDGLLRVAYEEIARTSILAVPCGRVIYDYRLGALERRLHIGAGLGAAATADALWADVRALARNARANGGAR